MKSDCEGSDEMSIVRAIRQFVSRGGDQQVYNDVLDATCYRLPLKRQTPCSVEEKTAILNRIRKEWTENETKWRGCLAEQERVTRCRSTRVPNGFYVYQDIDTGLNVPLEEYRQRYATYLLSARSPSSTVHSIDSHVVTLSSNRTDKACDSEDIVITEVEGVAITDSCVVAERLSPDNSMEDYNGVAATSPPTTACSMFAIESGSDLKLGGGCVDELASISRHSMTNSLRDDASLLQCTSLVTVTMVSDSMCILQSSMLPFPMHATVAGIDVSGPSTSDHKRQRII